MATLFTDIHELMTLRQAAYKKARGAMAEDDLSIAKKQVMVVDQGKIKWTGTLTKLPREWRSIKKKVKLDGNVFPGWIDCHTHAVFAGNRSHEFELRNTGVSYQEIQRQGGGIRFTVAQTRKSSAAQLQVLFAERMERFLRQGVTTVEVKSGYGLSVKDERKILKVIRDTPTKNKRIATFLGAHALPPEFSSRAEYLQVLKKELASLYKENLSRRLDIFIEENFFTVDEAREYLLEAKKIGYDLTIHADQLSRTGATQLALELGARSADHAICVNKADIEQIVRSPLTCVLLPASDFYIHCDYPPARAFLDGGGRVALSTDYNPGTSPTQNIQFVGLLARLQMKMSLPEVFVALTLGGAHALGLEKKRGALLPEFEADFFVSERSWKDFFYDLSSIEMKSVWVDGTKKV